MASHKTTVPPFYVRRAHVELLTSPYHSIIFSSLPRVSCDGHDPFIAEQQVLVTGTLKMGTQTDHWKMNTMGVKNWNDLMHWRTIDVSELSVPVIAIDAPNYMSRRGSVVQKKNFDRILMRNPKFSDDDLDVQEGRGGVV